MKKPLELNPSHTGVFPGSNFSRSQHTSLWVFKSGRFAPDCTGLPQQNMKRQNCNQVIKPRAGETSRDCWKNRTVYDGLEIYQRHPKMNRDIGMELSECLGSRPAWPYLFARTAWCLGLFVFRLSSLHLLSGCLFSVLVRTAGCLSPSPSLALVEASCHVVGFFFSSLGIDCALALLSLCFWKRLRLSRQAVKLRLLERFNELDWATTCRLDRTKLSLEFCSVNLCVSSFHQSFVPLVKTSVWSSPIRMCSFVSCWSSLFLIFRLESLCFCSKVSVSNYLSFPYCWFQICLYFPFRHFPCLVLRFFLDRIQNRCFPSRRIRYGFFNNPGWSPRPGALSLGYSFALSYLLRKPSTIWRETSRLKNSETGVLGTRKIGTGEYSCVTRVQF